MWGEAPFCIKDGATPKDVLAERRGVGVGLGPKISRTKNGPTFPFVNVHFSHDGHFGLEGGGGGGGAPPTVVRRSIFADAS